MTKWLDLKGKHAARDCSSVCSSYISARLWPQHCFPLANFSPLSNGIWPFQNLNICHFWLETDIIRLLSGSLLCWKLVKNLCYIQPAVILWWTVATNGKGRFGHRNRIQFNGCIFFSACRVNMQHCHEATFPCLSKVNFKWSRNQSRHRGVRKADSSTIITDQTQSKTGSTTANTHTFSVSVTTRQSEMSLNMRNQVSAGHQECYSCVIILQL